MKSLVESIVEESMSKSSETWYF